MTRLLRWLNWTLIGLCGVALLAGCHTFNGEHDWLGRDKRKEEASRAAPQKLVAIWSNSVINKLGEPAERGLGGRVYFYNEKHQPVQVTGGLTVYAYDDSADESRAAVEATRKFVFTKEQLASHMSPTDFGPSYSFWIPWDEAGGEQVQLSVIPVFTSADGQVVVGEQSRNLLPGKQPAQLAARGKDSAPRVSTADFQDVQSRQSNVATTAAQDVTKQPIVIASRINVPPTTRRRLALPPKQHERRAEVPENFPVSIDEASSSSTSEASPSRPTHPLPRRFPVRTSRFESPARDLVLNQPGLSTSPPAPAGSR